MTLTEQEMLKEKLHYDPDTGIFTALHSHSKRVKGQPVGYLDSNGYVVIGFNCKVCLAHRLVFLYMLGDWPTGPVDHKNGDRSNNSWSNLRVVSNSTNSRNRKKSKNNTSGTTGVYFQKDSNKWYASIYVEGKVKHLGLFDYEQDAIFARMTAEKKYGYWVDKVRED